MAEFVKKTIMGYREVADGQSDTECTHIILTRAEYRNLIYEKDKMEQEMLKIKQEVKYYEESLQNETEDRIRQIKEQLGRKIDAAQKEIDYLKGLNANLLRISRERANADRKLRPKKKHTGYTLISSEEKDYHYKSEYGELKATVLWQTVLQTPYSIEFTEEQVRNLLKEMNSEEGDLDILEKIGIESSYTGRYEDMIKDRRYDLEKQGLNIMLSRKLRANYRSGYWEFIFSHTKPLGVVPEDMRMTK